MKIGNHEVDRKLFEMYIRAITATKASPFEAKYDDERWALHTRILEDAGLRRGGAAYYDSPSRMQSPTRKSVMNAMETSAHLSLFPNNPAAEEFNDALQREVEMFLEHC